MTDLIAEIQKAVDRKSDLRLLDAVATGANTVTVGQSTVAVTLPAIIPVVSGDFCQVLEQGLNRVIIGPVGTSWATISLASANWTETRTPRWRREGSRIWLTGVLTRSSGTFSPGDVLFNLGTGTNPPTPTSDLVDLGSALVAAQTPDAVAITWVVNNNGTFHSAAQSYTLVTGDIVNLDGVSWAAG